MEDVKNFVIGEDGTIIENVTEEIFTQDFVYQPYIPTTVISSHQSSPEYNQNVPTSVISGHQSSPLSHNQNVIETGDVFADGKSYLTLNIIDGNAPFNIGQHISPQQSYYDNPYSVINPETKEQLYAAIHQEQPEDIYENFATKIVILNPDGTLSEEFMLPDGVDFESIQEIADSRDIIADVSIATPSNSVSINTLQHPIPKKDLMDAHSSLRSNQAPRTVIESALTELKSFKHQTDVVIKSEPQLYEHSQPVFLEQKENFLLLDEVNSRVLMEPSDFHKSVQLPSPQYNRSPQYDPTQQYTAVDYSLPTAPYPNSLEIRNQPVDLKIKKPKSERSHATIPYNPNRKTKSLGALGKALHGLPRDSGNQAMQICPLCRFQATTKNPYRHLQDHLARVHFKERLARELPSVKPFRCPVPVCQGKAYTDWQAVMRHYIGNKHGILEMYVREMLEQRGQGE